MKEEQFFGALGTQKISIKHTNWGICPLTFRSLPHHIQEAVTSPIAEDSFALDLLFHGVPLDLFIVRSIVGDVVSI